MSTEKYNMDTPIWLFVYDFGQISKAFREDKSYTKEGGPLVYPQAHTYAFETEQAAKEHAKSFTNPKDYILQKVYIQKETEKNPKPYLWKAYDIVPGLRVNLNGFEYRLICSKYEKTYNLVWLKDWSLYFTDFKQPHQIADFFNRMNVQPVQCESEV